MTASERKAKQRERQKQQGLVKVELLLDTQEMEMLQRNCALRRPGRDPYDIAEYLSMLIRIDDRSVISLVIELNKRRCKNVMNNCRWLSVALVVVLNVGIR